MFHYPSLHVSYRVAEIKDYLQRESNGQGQRQGQWQGSEEPADELLQLCSVPTTRDAGRSVYVS